jgi:hypothetical protein
MILIDNSIRPSDTVLGQLQSWQAEIVGDFAARKSLADSGWKSRSSRGNGTFDCVRKTLSAMCNGAMRCMYCEDSAGDSVDHFWPKSRFPDQVFSWENLNCVCSNCNTRKNAKFKVALADGQIVAIIGFAENEEPPTGEHILINPRVDDPMHFALLDLRTFTFCEGIDLTKQELERYEYTFDEVLKLSHPEREHLISGRRQAFGDFKARLKEYLLEKNDGKSAYHLAKFIDGIQRHNHQFVWREIQRHQRNGWLIHVDSALASMFTQAPEALTW